MSGSWQRLKEAFIRLKKNPQIQNMMSSPITKIVAANSVLFVNIDLCSCYGGSREYQRLF